MPPTKPPTDDRVARAAHAANVAHATREDRNGRGDRVVREERVGRHGAALFGERGRGGHVEMTTFLYAIIDAAERLRDACAFDGGLALPLDSRYTLLRAIERCGGAPSFADLGRLLRLSRPSARERALAAAAAGVVELLPCPDDRRLILVALTPAGRRALEARRMPPLDWVFTLLNGLPAATMASCEHVLRVLSARLERYEKEGRRARRGTPGAY